MGGRGQHMNRVGGQISPKHYQAVGIIRVGDRQVKLIRAVSTGGSRDLPTYSNSPNSVYARLDQETGRVESIRVYQNHRAVIDLDYHESQGIGPHWHPVNFEKSTGKKGATGRSKKHFPIDKLKPEYREFATLLDQEPPKPKSGN